MPKRGPTQKTPKEDEVPAPERKDRFGALKRATKRSVLRRTSTNR